MKRITLALAGMLLISCTSLEQYAEVRFTTGLVESGSMTKSTRQDTIQTMIAGRLPSTMPLTLRSQKTGTTYDTEIGQSILLPVGTYRIGGYSENASLLSVFPKRAELSATAQVMVSQNVGITAGTSTVPLEARHNGFAIVIDTKEVAEVSVESTSCPASPVPFSISGNYGIVFVNGDLADKVFTLVVKPRNLDNSDAKRISLSGIPREGCVAVENGKYYILHCTDVEKVESGFIMNVPAMGEIDLK